MLARYYGSGVGRFLEVDASKKSASADDPQSWNRYAYSGNNPVRFRDPDGEVKFDSLQTRINYNRARAYLRKQPGGRAIFRLLEGLKGAKEPTIRGNRRHDDSYDSRSNTIYWDPTSGLNVGGQGGSPDSHGGNIQTPALGLAHEANHAIRVNLNPGQYQKDRNTSDSQYSNLEERRVVAKGETALAEGLDEPTRKTHGANSQQPFVRTQCPACK